MSKKKRVHFAPIDITSLIGHHVLSAIINYRFLVQYNRCSLYIINIYTAEMKIKLQRADIDSYFSVVMRRLSPQINVKSENT